MDNYHIVVSGFLGEILDEELAQPDYHQTLWQVLDQGPESVMGTSIKTLPLLTCAANGEDPLAAVPVAAAWQVIHRAAKLFDDVEDGEAGQSAEMINAGTGLLFVAQLALSKLPEHHARPISHELSRAVLRSCAGQHLDLAASLTQADPETWLEIARAKSGALLAWAAWAGAWLAGGDESTLAGFTRYGAHLGILLQVADDFNGIWGADRVSDLVTGHLNLSVCYALSILEGQGRNNLETLLERATGGDKTAEQLVRQQLIDLGAQGYLLVVGRLQRQEAVVALQKVKSASSKSYPLRDAKRYQPLVTLLDQVLPVVGG